MLTLSDKSEHEIQQKIFYQASKTELSLVFYKTDNPEGYFTKMNAERMN